MPNRVLTDEEIWQAWKHGGGDAQDFARRIEALVIERIEKATKVAAMRQRIDERLTLGKHEGAEDGKAGGPCSDSGQPKRDPAQVGRTITGARTDKAELGRQPSDSLAQDEIERHQKEFHHAYQQFKRDGDPTWMFATVAGFSELARRLLKDHAAACRVAEGYRTGSEIWRIRAEDALKERDEARRLYEKLYELDWYRGYEPPWSRDDRR